MDNIRHSTHLFNSAWTETQKQLNPLGMREQAVPTEFAQRLNGNGRFVLRSWEWSVGKGTLSASQLRLVHIQGANSEIFNVWIVPEQPPLYPLLVTELLLVSGRLRVGFWDLQIPELISELRDRVLSAAKRALERTSLPLSQEAAPDWAIRWGSGYHLYTRPEAEQDLALVMESYAAYLAAWVELAGVPAPLNLANCYEAPPCTLRDYFREHLRHSPVRTYLTKIFGEDWSTRFLCDFLYR